MSVGSRYFSGDEGVAEDPERAVELWIQAAPAVPKAALRLARGFTGDGALSEIVRESGIDPKTYRKDLERVCS